MAARCKENLGQSVDLITPTQCRAARALVDWSQAELAEHAGVGLATLRDFERGARATDASTIAKLRGALEAAGVAFLFAGKASGKSAGDGVRLNR